MLKIRFVFIEGRKSWILCVNQRLIRSDYIFKTLTQDSKHRKVIYSIYSEYTMIGYTSSLSLSKYDLINKWFEYNNIGLD